MPSRLRIAQVAPPLEPVPPPAYGGTERIVAELVDELDRRGHEVTTFAAGDSQVAGRLVPTVPRALWPAGFSGDPAPWFLATIEQVAERAHEFDLIHSHLEWYSPLLARLAPVPVVATFHGRLDLPWAHELLRRSRAHRVAISAAQAATLPDIAWAAVVHNGLTLEDAPILAQPGEDLAFVGRIAPEKGVIDAIEVAVLTGRRLRIAAKSGTSSVERDYISGVFRPALERAGSSVEWLGELTRPDRDRLLSESAATLMPAAWPEPFGLVAIESLACGTPVIARRAGALPEIVRHGIDGFFGDDVAHMAFLLGGIGTLDRPAIRRSVLERFSAARMVDGYEAVYRTALGEPADRSGSGRPPVPIRVVTDDDAQVSPSGAPRAPGTPDWPEPAPARDGAASGARATG